ncbi:MAG TPA: hypothetical protein DCG49_05175 [Ruminococcus sp.]|nr:hypothetical protein [Ruminococcus sp.]
MHKKLRLRFLLLSWVLLLLFLIALCAGISIYLYQSSVDETEKVLQTCAESMHLDDKTRGMAGVWLDEHGKVTKTEQQHLNLTDETIEKLVQNTEHDGEMRIGEIKLEDMHYRYITVLRQKKAWVVFAECSEEDALVKTLRRNSVLFSLLGMVLLLPVCYLLTKWVSRPMETAWEKQNDFVSDATHELKTPLTVIAANTEAVMANPESTIESQERWLGSIQGETNRMASLVGNLLFLAKIDAGEIKLNREEFDISDMLEEMCMNLESDVFESGKVFEYEMTPDIHYNGDRMRIKQMAKELLDNAQQYTPEGGNIRVILNRDRKQNIRLLISNSGTALSEEDCVKIFDRFYRVDPSRARNTGGCGLGLCVAKGIAELHGGSITASSANGINVFTTILTNAEKEDVKIHKKRTKKAT